MNQDILDQLKETFLFRGAPEETLKALIENGALRRFPAGTVLMREGEEGSSLFLIHEGSVKIVTADSKGDELIINTCGPGEIIGEMALLDRAPRSATVVAIADVDALELQQDAFQELLHQRPDLTMDLIRAFSSRLRFSTTYIQKAIEWTQSIAAGDYSVLEDGPVVSVARTVEDKAGQLLSEFFKMAKNVKAREDELREKLEKLSLEIDEARRKQEFEEITGSDFYANLKAQAQALRAKRRDQ